MGKVVKTLLVVAVAVVLVTVALPALTAALGAAFAGSASAFAAASATSMAVLAAKVAAAMIIAVASSLATALIIGKPRGLNQSAFSSLTMTVDPTATRKIVFGMRAAGADERFHEKVNKRGQYDPGNDTDGDYLCKVVALASHKVHSIDAVYFEDALSFNGSSVQGKFSKGLSVQAITEGTASNAAAFASGTYWTSAARFTGCAYLKLKFKLDSEIYPNGIPNRITTVVKGCPVYDPRLDSTNGGSGSHRPDNQNTWSYLNGADEIGRNPALALLTYIIGYRINGKLAWGMGIPANRIDLGNFIAYANMCDEPVTTKVGGTVKRYQCDVILSTGESHDANIGLIAAAMGSAKLVDTGGLYQLVGGYDDLDGPVFTFTLDDIIGQFEWNPSAAALKDRFNIARGRFTNPDKLYQVEDWGSVEIAPLDDGIPRPVVVELPAVTRAETCQRIAKQLLVRNAYTGTFTALFGPRAFAVQVGSLVRLVIPQLNWAQPGKLFRVISQSEGADLIFQIQLQEEDPQIYAWDASEAVDLPPDVRPPAFDPSESIGVEDLASTTRTIQNSNGGTQSQIDVTWTPPDAAVQAIQIEVRETSGSSWSTATDRFNHKAGEFSFSALAGGINHTIRARYIMWSGIYGHWTETATTAAPDTNAPAISGYLSRESVTFAADANGTIL